MWTSDPDIVASTWAQTRYVMLQYVDKSSKDSTHWVISTAVDQDVFLLIPNPKAMRSFLTHPLCHFAPFLLVWLYVKCSCLSELSLWLLTHLLCFKPKKSHTAEKLQNVTLTIIHMEILWLILVCHGVMCYLLFQAMLPLFQADFFGPHQLQSFLRNGVLQPLHTFNPRCPRRLPKLPLVSTHPLI